jgi:hypothetical protein
MKGMVLTDRDRALLGYLGAARYVTAAQAHRLIAPGRDKAITSRRLARLCELGPSPGGDAFLRRLEYRRRNGLPFPVWTLTPHGRAVAEPVAPGPAAASHGDVGIRFVERVLALNEVLLALVLAARRSETAPLTALPFRWRACDEPLRFEVYERYHTIRPAILRPGAIIDFPHARRRIFLEPELGVTSFVPVDPREAHVKRRLERYSTFFVSCADRNRDRSWYQAAFPDDFYAEVLVLARTEIRRVRIERHLKDWFRGGPHYAFRAVTFPDAVAALTKLVTQSASTAAQGAPDPARSSGRSTPAAPAVRTVAIDADLARRIGDGMTLFVETYNSIRKETSAHSQVCPMGFRPAPGPVAELNAFNDLVWHDILGVPREPKQDRKP